MQLPPPNAPTQASSSEKYIQHSYTLHPAPQLTA
jgi:hypothetical protein